MTVKKVLKTAEKWMKIQPLDPNTLMPGHICTEEEMRRIALWVNRRVPRDEGRVIAKMMVNGEDLYRMLCGLEMLGDGLKNSHLVTLKRRGQEIKGLSNELDGFGQALVESRSRTAFLYLRLEPWQAGRSTAEDRLGEMIAAITEPDPEDCEECPDEEE